MIFKVSIDYFTLCDIIETLAAGATDLLVFQICNNFFYIFTISFKISWYLGAKYNIILYFFQRGPKIYIRNFKLFQAKLLLYYIHSVWEEETGKLITECYILSHCNRWVIKSFIIYLEMLCISFKIRNKVNPLKLQAEFRKQPSTRFNFYDVKMQTCLCKKN